MITKNNKIVLQGNRNPTNNLWYTNIPTEEQCHNVYHTSTIKELIQFLHGACGNPVPSSWIKAIDKGHFATWPGLTSEMVKKHLPKSEATIKGHLNQIRKNVRSTKQPTLEEDIQTSQEKTEYVYATIIEPTDKIATDLTGRFPITSKRGGKYIMILYDYDSNAILAEVMVSRTETEHIRSYKKLITYLESRGRKPKFQKLDNEASTAIKKLIKDKGIDLQLVPPHIHRRNAAERAIQMFKNHFIAILSNTHKKFPLYLWDLLVPQAQMTLNMLRTSRINPKLSAYEQLEGIFNFNRTPLAPPGTKVIIHEKPTQRQTWEPHGQDGWYIGPAMEHYRCYKVYVSATGAERIADTIEFFPNQPMPCTSSTDAAIIAAQQLILALKNPAPPAPFETFESHQYDTIQKIADIYQTQATTVTQPIPEKWKANNTKNVSKDIYAQIPRVPTPRVTPMEQPFKRH